MPWHLQKKGFLSDKPSHVCSPRLYIWAELSLTEQVCLPKQGVKYLASPLVPEERQDKRSGRSCDRKGVFHTNKCELISLTLQANGEGPKNTSRAKINWANLTWLPILKWEKVLERKKIQPLLLSWMMDLASYLLDFFTKEVNGIAFSCAWNRRLHDKNIVITIFSFLLCSSSWVECVSIAYLN